MNDDLVTIVMSGPDKPWICLVVSLAILVGVGLALGTMTRRGNS